MAADATSHHPIRWSGIHWQKSYRIVHRLQARIVKAVQVRNNRKVRALQHILTHSLSGASVAVRRVTENRGKNTAGIDKVTWNTPQQKTEAIREIRQGQYQAKSLRRIYIPKTNGQLRPLGIPVMKCRAMQALHLLALDPIAECYADTNSYGVRPPPRSGGLDGYEQPQGLPMLKVS